MIIYFVRHGKDDDSLRGGWNDADLIPEGRQQAKLLAEYLKKNNREYCIGQIFSSDLKRAMSTARYISDELNLPVQKEYRLREMNNGDLAGMPNDLALERYPGLFFRTLRMDETYPNGESPNDFYARIKKWFDDFVNQHKNDDKNILVITHGGVINIIYHIVNEKEWSNKSPAYKSSNCSIHILNTETMKFEAENITDFLTN